MTENRVSPYLSLAGGPAAPSANGFMACPVALMQNWASEIYRIALERALADARPSPWMRRIMTAGVN
ncbi:MAG: hypothetical protein ACJ8F7_20795 [Gemmataceae bacterium]